MALQKQVISIPMSLGIDAENSPPLIDNQRFAYLSNAVFDKTQSGQIHKRDGHSPATTSVLGGGVLPAAEALTIFNSELGAIAGGSYYGLSSSQNKWIKRGTLPLIQQVETNIAAGAFSVANPDAVILNGIGYYAYEMNGSSWVKVVDDAGDKTVLATIQLVTGSTSSNPGGATVTPKILSTGSNVIALSVQAQGGTQGTVYATSINATTFAPSINEFFATQPLDPWFPTGVSTVAEFVFDAQIISGTLFIVGIASSQLIGNAFTLPGFGVIGGSNVVLGNTLVAPAALSCTTVGGAQLAVSYQVSPGSSVGTVGGLYTNYYSSSSPWTPGTTGNKAWHQPAAGTWAPTPRLATMGVTTTAGDVIVLFFEQPPVAGSSVLSAIYYYTDGITVPITWSTGCNIAGLPFLIGSGPPYTLYLPVVYSSQVQQTFFLTYTNYTTTPSQVLAQVAGRYFSANNAGAAPTNYRIPQSFINGSAQCLPVVVQPQGISASSVSASLSELSLSFGGELQSTQLGGNLHLACGSMLMDYDGTNIVEHNFHVYPETPTITQLTSQLTVITDGYDPICATGGASQSTFRIVVPDNAANPGGPVGQLINATSESAVPVVEYILFNAFSELTGVDGSLATPFAIYFVVNGVGTRPPLASFGVSGSNLGACNILSTMNATQVATAIYNSILAMGGLVTAQYTVTLDTTAQTNVATPQCVGLAGIKQPGSNTPVAISPPVLNLAPSFGTQVFVGSGVKQSAVAISFPPAKLIQSGQYVSFTTQSTYGWTSGSTVTQIYVWFSNPNNSVGSGNENLTAVDPMPFGVLTLSASPGGTPITYSNATGNYIGVKVTLGGSESELTVAADVLNALTNLNTIAPFSGGLSISSFFQVGNEIVFGTGTSGITALPQAQWPTPSPMTSLSGGVGQGAVGAVIDGSNQPYAAIEYSSVYEWIDNQNQLHQSAPSIPAIAYIPTYQAVGGGSIPALSAVPVSAVVQVATRPISQTLKISMIGTVATGVTDIDIAIYRTISGATVGNQIFYRITPTSAPLFNQPSSLAAITYADYSSDGEGITTIGTVATGVQANQLLYTTGGVIPNSAPPACSFVMNHQNRLWLSGLENPNEIWYSETWDSGFSVNFSNLQQVLLNPIVAQSIGGPIIGLASMDSNLLIFQEFQIWYIQGYGPDPTGANGFFSPPQVVASSSQIGCRDVNSITLMPNGVMFKSTQGYWLLGRDLQLRFVGAAVKSYNADIVTSGVALTKNSQINFLSNSGTTLTYDWYYDSWSTFTTQGMDSIIDANGTFNFITSSGAIWTQVYGQYIDGDGSPVLMTVTTAWLKPQNVQGFQRIWRLLAEGQFYGSQPYNVQIAYNYGAVVDSFIYNPGAGGSSLGTWGESATWGEFVWGEDVGNALTYANSIQVRIDNSNQLCESLQLTISDLPPVPINQTWSLNALDLVIGIRSGGFKRIGPPQSIG